MLPSAARTWLSEHRGEVLHVVALGSTQGEVWRVDMCDGTSVVVKTGSAASIEREVWGVETAGALGRVPRILGRPSTKVLLLSWCPGEQSAEPEVVREAGAWLRRLHAVPCAYDDPLDLRDALERRRDAWLARAGADLDVSRVEILRFDAFAGLPRVACHRDFTPSNWLWDGEVGLSVVDFGQSRPDARVWDLAKLEAELFRSQPVLREVFHEGYGGLDAEERGRLDTLVLLHGLQTAVWGDTHGDSVFSALGRDILRSG